MNQGRLSILLGFFIFCLSGCGMFGFIKVESTNLSEGYQAQAAMNPDKICTPYMFYEVWAKTKESFYRPITNKEMFIGAAEGLAKALSGKVEIPDYKTDEGYGPEHFWFFLTEKRESSKKNISDLCYAALEGLFSGGLKDEYSSFWDAKKSAERYKLIAGEKEYYGLGTTFTADFKNKRLFVDEVFKESPAERAGLRKYDEILEVDGKDLKTADLKEIAYKFRGKKDSFLSLKTRRKAGVRDGKIFYELRDWKIRRGRVDYKDAFCRLEGDIVYCRILSFTPKTAKDFIASFEGLPKKHAKKIIIDLRNNTGGNVFSGTHLLSRLWFENKVVMVVVKKKFGIVPFNDNNKNPLLRGYKAVVLVNGITASTSEIFAGAVKDYGAARLIGEKTFGKGVLQDIHFVYGAILIVRSMYFMSPLGHYFHKKGISPDVEIKMHFEDLVAGRDPQLEAARKYLNK